MEAGNAEERHPDLKQIVSDTSMRLCSVVSSIRQYAAPFLIRNNESCELNVFRIFFFSLILYHLPTLPQKGLVFHSFAVISAFRHCPRGGGYRGQWKDNALSYGLELDFSHKDH